MAECYRDRKRHQQSGAGAETSRTFVWVEAPQLRVGEQVLLHHRAGRRFGWRLAGGRLLVTNERLIFVPNVLERRNPAAAWECATSRVASVEASWIWLRVVSVDEGTEVFRMLGSVELRRFLLGALGLAP